LIFFWTNFEPKNDLYILSKMTGRISPRKMTLLIGPPGSGKSGNFVFILPQLVDV
jgi:ABC-type Mn2+/Zn2+ transport system ATPase subunit